MTSEPRRKGIDPLKVVFALAYVMQGLANPFQGVTTLPFLRHLQRGYGLTEGAAQDLFAKSYLAWSFKPIIGFLVDAYGRTRTLLIGLLGFAALGYLLTPLFDRGPMVFFAAMFVLSVVMAGSDVAVDRATVISGDEEARATGKSRATTVGLNQAICWLAIYGTSIVAALLGGWVTDHVPFTGLVVALAAVPLMVLVPVLRLPRDTAVPIPVTRSIAQFWAGLNSGSVLGIMLFYFLFFFQPQAGPLFYNYQEKALHFTQSQIGIGTSAGMAGYFIGVLVFRVEGRRLAGALRHAQAVSPVHRRGPPVRPDPVRVAGSLVQRHHGRGVTRAPVPGNGGRAGRVSVPHQRRADRGHLAVHDEHVSLVGAIIPPAAAGSLFAGFMSVTNLAYSASYGSGGWLYDHGMSLAPLRGLQHGLFGIAGGPADKLSLNVLILIGSLAYFASFVAVHLLPDRAATLSGDGANAAGPERWLVLPSGLRRAINGARSRWGRRPSPGCCSAGRSTSCRRSC